MNSRIIITLAAILVALSGCAHEAPQAMIGSEPSPRPPDYLSLDDSQIAAAHLTSGRVQALSAPVSIMITGHMEPNANMTTPVISPVPGRIESVSVQLGDSARTGQDLARLHSDEVAQIESDLLKQVLDLDADLEQERTHLDLARTVYERKEKLLGEGIAARADAEIAKSEYVRAQAEVKALEGKRRAVITSMSERLRLFGVPAGAVQRVIATRTIDNTFDVRSPRTGLVTARDVDVGELIDNEHPLFVVSDLSTLWLIANVFEKDIGKIRTGLPVAVSVDSYPGEIFAGRLDYMSSKLDEKTRTLPVRATVINEKMRLRPGMFARLTVEVGKIHALAVPAQSVQRTGETNLVYVVMAPHKYQERKVVTGRTLGNLVEIRDGLSEGEEVVVQGSLQLQGQALQRMSR